MCCRSRVHARITLVWSVCLVLGISSGASIGGWLSEYHGWHSIFYFSLPMTGFIFLTVESFLARREESGAEHALRLLLVLRPFRSA